ncbi:sugar phosphate isomerase/epimerase [Mycobacterium sp. MYCO198283]|uniref:sugar phosphate isomerase/epimerase family protein n=1 Tax=Mycobacterium sp. MYCO198283 TaxID=2883505 RepID=UPI001E5B27D2|nr:sugar phosphate isomerase/epimerase family protein [Mycobacterium sp. MYCO198283]MCG5431786.1 sugar phosphate isomerase/epimerase [Mycobacterium sp. MYCO198283]
MRYAYNTNGAANHRLDDAIRLIADAGYDGVALTLDHHHLDPLADGWRREAERVAALLDSLSLGSVVETGARYLLDPRDKHQPTLVSAEPAGRARRVDFLRRAVDVAAVLGSETVSCWAGVPKPGVDRDAAFGWLDAGLAQVCAYADSAGVSVSFEPEPGMLVETVGDYERLAARHPSLRLALDTGHCLVTQDVSPHDAVRRCAGALGSVAIEDMRRGDHTHLPFGEGDMDVPAVLAALRDVEWRGLVCVELSRESPRAHQAIPEAIDYLKAAQR